MEAQLMAAALVAIPGALVGARALARRGGARFHARALQRLDEELAALQATFSTAGSPTDPLTGEDAFLTLYRTRHAHTVLDSLVQSGRLLELPAPVVARVRDARSALLWWEEVANDLFLDLSFAPDVVDVGEGLQETLLFFSALDEVELRVDQLREAIEQALKRP